MCRWDNLAEDGETVQLCVTAWWSEATPAEQRPPLPKNLEEVQPHHAGKEFDLFEVGAFINAHSRRCRFAPPGGYT